MKSAKAEGEEKHGFLIGTLWCVPTLDDAGMMHSIATVKILALPGDKIVLDWMDATTGMLELAKLQTKPTTQKRSFTVPVVSSKK